MQSCKTVGYVCLQLCTSTGFEFVMFINWNASRPHTRVKVTAIPSGREVDEHFRLTTLGHFLAPEPFLALVKRNMRELTVAT